IRLKAASRARSEVGRVSCPFGVKIRAPLLMPAMILTDTSRTNRAAQTCLWTESHTFVAVAMSARDSSNGQSTRTAQPSRQRVDLRAREETIDFVVERPFVRDQFLGELPRPFEQLAIGAQAREPQLPKSPLAGAEQLALAAKLQVLPRELEAVRRRDERLQPSNRVVRQLFAGT